MYACVWSCDVQQWAVVIDHWIVWHTKYLRSFLHGSSIDNHSQSRVFSTSIIVGKTWNEQISGICAIVPSLLLLLLHTEVGFINSSWNLLMEVILILFPLENDGFNGMCYFKELKCVSWNLVERCHYDKFGMVHEVQLVEYHCSY